MLTPIAKTVLRAGGQSFAIVASQYNARYVDAMVRAARAELKRAGARRIRVVKVPGAYEIPLVAACLARDTSERKRAPQPHHQAHVPLSSASTPALGAIICLGVILRGETVHAAHIGEAVSRALMEIQLRYAVPVVHEVLLLENEEQARARCLGKTHNRGAEAAHTALAMAQLMATIRPSAPEGE
jgi:6,7-dimethyl-8-ribityllumazine synthase